MALLYTVFAPAALPADFSSSLVAASAGESAAFAAYRFGGPPALSGSPFRYCSPVLIYHHRGHRRVATAGPDGPVEREVADGQVTLLPGKHDVAVEFLEPYEGVVLGLAPDLVAAAAARKGLGPVTLPAAVGVDDPFLRSIGEALWHCGSDRPAVADALGAAAADHLAGAYAAPAAPRQPAWLRKALDVAAREFAGPLRVGDWAARAGLSRCHFTTEFTRLVGVAPHAHLLRLRLGRARELIGRHPNWTLAAVAARSGFADASHLAAHFRAAFGRTPGEFRRAAEHPSRPPRTPVPQADPAGGEQPSCGRRPDPAGD